MAPADDAEALGQGSRSTDPPHRVLVVPSGSDHTSARALRDAGHEVIVVAAGHTASMIVAVAVDEDVDFVVLDRGAGDAATAALVSAVMDGLRLVGLSTPVLLTDDLTELGVP